MKRGFAWFVATALIVACGGPSAGVADRSRECDALASSARSDLEAVFAANQSCAKSEDCGHFPWATRCATRNTRLLATSASAKLEAEVAKVDASQCALFVEKGCALERDPPAAPPRPASCVAGRCEP
ncbi:MAG: hypothetical protein U0270_33590 [Labilithrix sp.]